jgi:phosphoglycolate phosphatase
MKFKAVIFDLDGTLINSLEDIADSMNTVLKTNKYPTHNYEAYNYFIGSGTRNLVAKALPKITVPKMKLRVLCRPNDRL